MSNLLAVSDLHVSHPQNRALVNSLRPRTDEDWLLIAGDVAEDAGDLDWTLGLLTQRFSKVVWTPGNHELWTRPSDPLQLRGEPRYRYLVDLCRRSGAVSPEDPYPVWEGDGGPAVVAPLFLLYDYSFRMTGTRSKAEALAAAAEAGVLCADEVLLHPDPYSSREAWCAERIAITERRLSALDASVPTVLVNHYPLTRGPTSMLRCPEFALWCGTERTADWHLRFRATAVVYGHLHIPRTSWHDGVRAEEVSIGYPREWQRYGSPRRAPRKILPGTT